MGQGASPGQSGIPGCLPASAGEPGGQAGLELLGQAGMVAVRVADLASPAREGLGKDRRTALAAAGAGKIGTGDLVVFCKPVAVAAAVVRRDGRVQAAGHHADHVRLGMPEERLDVLCGEPGVIGTVAAGVTLVPTDAVACTWRDAVGAAPLQQLRDRALAGIDAEHQQHGYRAVAVGELDVGSIDGSLARVPDTAGNGTRSGPRASRTGPRRIRSCGSCAARLPRPAPPWAW
jgi:hypothetical protein